MGREYFKYKCPSCKIILTNNTSDCDQVDSCPECNCSFRLPDLARLEKRRRKQGFSQGGNQKVAIASTEASSTPAVRANESPLGNEQDSSRISDLFVKCLAIVVSIGAIALIYFLGAFIVKQYEFHVQQQQAREENLAAIAELENRILTLKGDKGAAIVRQQQAREDFESEGLQKYKNEALAIFTECSANIARLDDEINSLQAKVDELKRSTFSKPIVVNKPQNPVKNYQLFIENNLPKLDERSSVFHDTKLEYSFDVRKTDSLVTPFVGEAVIFTTSTSENTNLNTKIDYLYEIQLIHNYKNKKWVLASAIATCQHGFPEGNDKELENGIIEQMIGKQINFTEIFNEVFSE